MRGGRPTSIMISSTTRDLPEHRRQAMDACLRQGFRPRMMEHLPSDPASGLVVSLRMADAADLYLLILGVRYGEVPEGRSQSITEAEYDRAIARRKPVLAFIGRPEAFPASQHETGDGAEKLAAFRRKVERKHAVSYFSSAEELGKLIVDSISRFRTPETAQNFHFVSEISVPPVPYIAHPYVLLESENVVGRKRELDLLTDWIRGIDPDLAGVRVMVLVAIGGMGKSALTWKWFSDLTSDQTSPLAGSLWWSFYESDATFENFVVRALAYVRHLPREDALAIPAAEREQQLLETLDAEPFLFCLDGIERLMVAYARSDAARMSEDTLDHETDNFVRAVPGTPGYAIESMRSPRRLRQTTDPRAGAFLRKLSRVRASRVVTTTRLYPADLQGETGLELPGCKAVSFGGMEDDDALALWSALGVRGDRDALLSVLRTVDNYPLLIRTMAGQIAKFRPAPGDFDVWLAKNPSFDPFSLPMIQRRTHVLQFALDALPDAARLVLVTLAAFQMPVPYGILPALFVGGGGALVRDSELHDALGELEDRGLVGWDRSANRYDLHPVVRGIVWHGVRAPGREIVHEIIRAHLATSPAVAEIRASSIDELTPATELYHTLIALGRHDEAFRFLDAGMLDLLLDRMNRFRVGAQLLEMLFPDGIEHAPRLAAPEDAERATWALAYCYNYAGEVSRTVEVWRRLAGRQQEQRLGALNNYGSSLAALGRLAEAEKAFAKCVKGEHDKSSPNYGRYRAQLGSIASVRGAHEQAETLLTEALSAFNRVKKIEQASDIAPLVHCFQHALRRNDVEAMRALAQRTMGVAGTTDIVQIRIDALEMHAWTLIVEERFREAEDALAQAFTIACDIGSESETDITIVLAELYRREGASDRVRDLLADIWEPLRRGPRRLRHADACNILAETELAAGRIAEAVDAASTAHRLAWCDGDPYSYKRAMERAREILARCGVPEPLAAVEDLT